MNTILKGYRRYTVKTGNTLTHVNSDGKASMVNIHHKQVTKRIAIAQGKVILGNEAFQLLKSNKIKKGDVLTVAQIAGIQGAKQTSNLIPLCHPLQLNQIQIDFKLKDLDYSVEINAKVQCDGKTGVEMEAIMAVSISACTIYDMCKAVNKGIIIENVKLISKTGGEGGDFVNQETLNTAKE
ncbi:GTP cyclohydrolase subunit MoaC [Globomyces pollinis-pini]|nr:GTP cyclohydrolase subunit MoaC [Globomyces pollinis-pini]